MSAADVDYLNAHAGVTPATDDELTAMAARSAGRVAVDVSHTLGRNAVAELLGVWPSRVSHQLADGKLYSYPGSGSRPLFPDWQFARLAAAPDVMAALPHLSDVLAAIPEGTHAIAVRTFMTTPTHELPTDGPVSPREWLRQGGAPDIVVRLADTLGKQV